MSAPTVLVTGGRGFIGRHLVARLREEGARVRVSTRAWDLLPDEVEADLSNSAALDVACAGVESVFHCAGHAHAFSSGREEEVRLHWQVNYEGTKSLAEAAARAGVRTFVFLSSVKAMGAPGAHCIAEDWPILPDSPYGQAKRAAEEVVLAIGKATGMGVTVLRPALVYGFGGRGNLERMGALVRRGCFPPLPETGNRRSLVHVTDLVSVLCRVAGEPLAVGKTYTIAHSHAPSGRTLYEGMRVALGYPSVRWAVPRRVLEVGATLGDLVGKATGRRLPFDRQVLDRLLESACYSPARIERELGWWARVGLEDGLRDMFGLARG